MFRSLSDYDVSTLLESSKDTLQKIAIPLSQGAKPDELAASLRITTDELSKRLEALGAELDSQTGGAVVRPPTAEEYEALRESIREHGQLVPALVDPSGKILAGHTRKRACDELGIKLQSIVYQGPPENARDVALAENFVRRHLRASDRRRAIAAEIINAPGRSDRSIAVVLGVDHTTVGRVRKELERQGQVVQSTTRTGRDGKTQRADRPAAPPSNPETRIDYITEELRSLAALEDREQAHARADELLVEAVKLLGGHGVAQAYEQSGSRFYRP